MSRLRHPVRAIREPFGTAGLIVAMVALVAALGGSALAANSALSGKQKKEVEKIAKKFSGKPGATGPAGAAGAAGKNGTDGTNGTSGGPGTSGSPGASVTNTTVKTTETSKCGGHGGTEFKVGTGAATFACNGTTGYTEFLPAGKTETGTWAVGEGPAHLAFVPLTFAIPVEGEHSITESFYVKSEQTVPGKCEGTVLAPQAEAGVLCVYASENEIEVESSAILNANGGGSGVGGPGAVLSIALEGSEGTAYGSFAVTAPEA
jgi:hypothetical protein